MLHTIVSLKQAWSQKLSEEFDKDQRETKIVQSPDGRGFFRVVYSKKLEEWYLSPEGKARYDKPFCFFCEEHDEYHKRNETKIIEHLKIFFNRKFVMRNHWLVSPIEHRSEPKISDFAVLQRIAEISGLIIFGNLRDSGASYPIHVHYQTLETEFPAISLPGELIYENKYLGLEKLRYPELVFRFSCEQNRTKTTIDHIGLAAISQPGSFNPIFYGKDIYLVPRTKSVPTNTGGFKFAAAEACGSFFVRTKKLFDIMDGKFILSALDDVCLPVDGIAAKLYEDRLITKIKETMA